MNNLLKKLQIRTSEKNIFFSFALYNFISYTGVFLGRSVRDALFFSKLGEGFLPYALISNAFFMLVYGGIFDKITGYFKTLKRNTIKLYFIFSVITFIFSYILNNFTLDLTIPITGNLKNLIIFVFFIFTEILFFTLINLVWVLADSYISESMGQRLNPKIIGSGQIGITIGGLIAVLIPQFFNLDISFLIYIISFFVFINIFIVQIIYKKCKQLPEDNFEKFFENTEIIIETKTNFIKELISNFKTIAKYKYSLFFAIITVFNFTAFAINDYMLTSRATNANIDENLLTSYLGWFTIFFGLICALFQFTSITSIIKKIGIAKTNLLGPLILTISMFILVLTSLDSFSLINQWISEKIDTNPTMILFFIMAGVRFAGYVVEYLFNQTLLPSIYGALPEEDKGTIRSTIEGPLTQSIIGLTGLGFIVYELCFENLDILIIFGLICASLMLYYSYKLIPEYKNILKISKTNPGLRISEKAKKIITTKPRKTKELFEIIKKLNVYYPKKSDKKTFLEHIITKHEEPFLKLNAIKLIVKNRINLSQKTARDIIHLAFDEMAFYIKEITKNEDNKHFLQKRADMLKEIIFYSLGLFIKDEDFKVKDYIKAIEFGNRIEKDDAITLLEQKLPRDIYLIFDKFFFIDDKENNNREEDLTNWAENILKNKKIKIKDEIYFKIGK